MSGGRTRYWKQIEELQVRLGINHTEARSRWSHYYEKGGKPKKAIKKLVLAVRASTTDQRTCPFCRDSIYHPDEGGPDYVCTKCQAHYHLDCFEEELGGACATLGCATRRVIGAARSRIRLRSRPTTPTTSEPVVLLDRARPVNTQMEIEEIPDMAALRARQNQPADGLIAQIRAGRRRVGYDPPQTPEEAQATQDADNAFEAGLDALERQESFLERHPWVGWIGDNMAASMVIGVMIISLIVFLIQLVLVFG